MDKPRKRAVVRRLLRDYGTTYADEIGIPLRNTPAPLFQLLCAALLYSAPIPSRNATQAMRALRKAGLTTPRKMAQASWQDRVDVLTSHGYKRYDESTSSMLGDAARQVEQKYRGDLRRLRRAAGNDPALERQLLTEFKGIGRVGSDIMLRELQGLWSELYPFVDARALESARRLKLAQHAAELARLVPRKQLSKLLSALIRVSLTHAYDDLLRAA